MNHMNERDILVADMYTWVFRHFQRRWNKSPEETADIFKEGGIYDFISDCYDSLCCSSYTIALEDVEDVLYKKGIKI